MSVLKHWMSCCECHCCHCIWECLVALKRHLLLLFQRHHLIVQLVKEIRKQVVVFKVNSICLKNYDTNFFKTVFGPQIHGGGGGATPYISHYRYILYVLPIGWGFWAVLVWKWVYTLPILVWNQVWFSKELRSVWTYWSFQFQMSKQKREIGKFKMDWKFFCLHCNGVSNDNIISA